MESEITKIYGNRLRVRVCGICWIDDQLLLVNHKLSKRDFWAPPGGGIEFGQSAHEALTREFKEETNLDIKPGAFLFACEFNKPPLHAIELFFEVQALTRDIRTGSDPELQLIEQVRLFTPEQIHSMPSEDLHGIFRIGTDTRKILALKGFYTL